MFTWADRNRDGDLDLFAANVNHVNNALYENQANDNHWLQVVLAGVGRNRSGIGSRIRLKSVIAGAPVWQLREISVKNGYSSRRAIWWRILGLVMPP